MTSPSYRLLIPYAPTRTTVLDFSPTRHQRQPHPDNVIESSIETTWATRQQANAMLFNASKFRLSHTTNTASTATLHLGLTDYKTYLGTHFPLLPRRHRALPLGNVVVVRSTDNQTAVLVRSSLVADAPDAAAFPGGHAEPSMISKENKFSEGDIRVEYELVDGARREVLEELFIPNDALDTVDQFKFLGVVERLPDEKPSVVYYAEVAMNAQQIVDAYRVGNVAKDESVRLTMLPIEQLHDVVRRARVDAARSTVAELLGAAELWCMMNDCR